MPYLLSFIHGSFTHFQLEVFDPIQIQIMFHSPFFFHFSIESFGTWKKSQGWLLFLESFVERKKIKPFLHQILFSLKSSQFIYLYYISLKKEEKKLGYLPLPKPLSSLHAQPKTSCFKVERYHLPIIMFSSLVLLIWNFPTFTFNQITVAIL